ESFEMNITDSKIGNELMCFEGNNARVVVNRLAPDSEDKAPVVWYEIYFRHPGDKFNQLMKNKSGKGIIMEKLKELIPPSPEEGGLRTARTQRVDTSVIERPLETGDVLLEP